MFIFCVSSRMGCWSRRKKKICFPYPPVQYLPTPELVSHPTSSAEVFPVLLLLTSIRDCLSF